MPQRHTGAPALQRDQIVGEVESRGPILPLGKPQRLLPVADPDEIGLTLERPAGAGMEGLRAGVEGEILIVHAVGSDPVTMTLGQLSLVADREPGRNLDLLKSPAGQHLQRAPRQLPPVALRRHEIDHQLRPARGQGHSRRPVDQPVTQRDKQGAQVDVAREHGQPPFGDSQATGEPKLESGIRAHPGGRVVERRHHQGVLRPERAGGEAEQRDGQYGSHGKAYRSWML